MKQKFNEYLGLKLGISLCILGIIFFNHVNGQLIRPDLMNFGEYNPETKKYEKKDPINKELLIGGGDHDYKPHKKESLIGGGDHDYKPHKKKSLIGGGDHDYKPHKKESLIGGGDHDYKPHKKESLIGGGDHDYKPHKKESLIGGGDHDYKPHKKESLIGGGDHDYKTHKKESLLGGGDHDYKKPHKKESLIGGGDHDYKPHKKHLLGGDHDYKLHKKHQEHDHENKHNGKKLFGNDGHDLLPHKKQYHRAVDGHMKNRKKALLGGDDHDLKLHKEALDLCSMPRSASFDLFVQKFNRNYTSEEEKKQRFRIFRSNLKKICVLNRNKDDHAHYGLTKFADWSSVEFRRLLGLRPDLKPTASRMVPAQIPDSGDLPDSFDWRTLNVVTPVKNQGMCGSCWAFSVTGNVEGQWAIKHKTLYSLSEQELVDCDETDKGCDGGMPESAYEAILELGGLETEAAYPYEAKDDTCHLNPDKIKVKVNGSVELPEDETEMAKWLVKNGPISIGINANALQFYVGGVSHPFKFLCSPDSLDHGMLIVGFGVHTTKYLHREQPYWLVKNSWGQDWGEEGYYRVFRGDGTCGVNKMATSATVP